MHTAAKSSVKDVPQDKRSALRSRVREQNAAKDPKCDDISEDSVPLNGVFRVAGCGKKGAGLNPASGQWHIAGSAP